MADFSDLGTMALRYIGWGLIPTSLTNRLIPPIHKHILHRPTPPPGSPQYQTVYRNTYALVILSYLTFNLAYAAYTTQPNFYDILGVTLNSDEQQIKSAFRQFARRNHPDKVGESGVDRFMRVRTAYEALMNPVKRFAYDRCVFEIRLRMV